MTVLFYGAVLTYTNGEKSFGTEACSSVRDLIDRLGVRYGERAKKFLLGDGTCFFLVNGKGLMASGGLDAKLKPDDKIEVLPFIDAG
jgi:molybdopterin converting factor small subunit